MGHNQEEAGGAKLHVLSLDARPRYRVEAYLLTQGLQKRGRTFIAALRWRIGPRQGSL
jgi:hypothetical protein